MGVPGGCRWLMTSPSSQSLPGFRTPCPHPATVIADYEMLSLSCILLRGKNFNVFVFVIRGPGLWDRPAFA